jgi:hypothetical protein
MRGEGTNLHGGPEVVQGDSHVVHVLDAVVQSLWLALDPGFEQLDLFASPKNTTIQQQPQDG